MGTLLDELFRAVRLVVDTGIHAKRWTRAEAVAYMRANTGKPQSEVQAEVDRYIVMPGQATAYMIGMLKLLELRDRASERLAGRFDIREFHDLILRSGPLPLAILDEVVEAWIADASAANR